MQLEGRVFQMQSNGVPFNIAGISVDPITMLVCVMVGLVVLGLMLGVRRDVALGLFVTGALMIALTT